MRDTEIIKTRIAELERLKRVLMCPNFYRTKSCRTINYRIEKLTKRLHEDIIKEEK